MKINVLDSDIKTGRKYNPNRCPVAKAIRRTVGKSNLYSTMVFISSVEMVFKNKTFFELILPKKVEDFINSFDRGLKVKPFSFSLKIPKKA